MKIIIKKNQKGFFKKKNLTIYKLQILVYIQILHRNHNNHDLYNYINSKEYENTFDFFEKFEIF